MKFQWFRYAGNGFGEAWNYEAFFMESWIIFERHFGRPFKMDFPSHPAGRKVREYPACGCSYCKESPGIHIPRNKGKTSWWSIRWRWKGDLFVLKATRPF